jgi:proteic killer suppression protein
VDIQFDSAQIRKLCNDHKVLTQKLQKKRADLVAMRLQQMEHVDNLAQMNQFPQAKCHPLLYAGRRGQLAVWVDNKYRIVFVPLHDPQPTKADGSLDWGQVTAINIIEIVDYHG